LNHSDHVSLLRPAALAPGGTWADFGAGAGAFTLALRELVGPGAHIYAVDKDQGALKELERNYAARFGSRDNLHTITHDFSQSLDLPALDGVVMANSLHYTVDKTELLRHVATFLKSGGALLLVEYNVDKGNMWVPHPLSFETWKALVPRAGFSEPRLLAKHPSSFLKEFYAAVCYTERYGE
jgi:ubiquinone/menaquinone biosynthesis C-methylase UbiE